MNANFPYASVLAPQAGFVPMQLLAALEPPQNVFNRVLVGVELGYVMADVLVFLISQHGQLRAVGPQDGAVARHPMHGHNPVLQEIGQVGLAFF